MAFMSGEGKLTVTGFVGYPNGLTWMHQWFKTSQYLGRLRQIYTADPANNIDLVAIVDALMISCAHMWDAFKNDAGLPSITKAVVDEAMTGDSSLRLCRDYANTAKHLKRSKPSDIEASVFEAGSKGSGNFVTIGYGPATSPRESTVDSLALANASYAEWQRFMRDHSIEDPVAVTAGLLNPPTG
jgi:hypothetical protein